MKMYVLFLGENGMMQRLAPSLNHNSRNYDRPRNFKLLQDPAIIPGCEKMLRYDGIAVGVSVSV